MLPNSSDQTPWTPHTLRFIPNHLVSSSTTCLSPRTRHLNQSRNKIFDSRLQCIIHFVALWYPMFPWPAWSRFRLTVRSGAPSLFNNNWPTSAVGVLAHSRSGSNIGSAWWSCGCSSYRCIGWPAMAWVTVVGVMRVSRDWSWGDVDFLNDAMSAVLWGSWEETHCDFVFGFPVGQG